MKNLRNIVFMVLVSLVTKQAFSPVLLNSQKPKDLTLDAGSRGVNVVDATLAKINSASKEGLKNDFEFLKRIALVESNFGEAKLAHPNGGIWQISPYIANEITRSTPNPSQTLQDIFIREFGKHVVNFANKNFNLPLRSAIAARIYIESLLDENQNYPASLEEQAQFWATRYRRNSTQDPDTFVARVRDYEEDDDNQCIVSTMDLWFLIDGSGSVGSQNFQESLDFVNKTAAVFVIAPDRVRTGLMIYYGSVYVISYLNQHQSNEEFSAAIFSTSYPGGGTQTGRAITAVHENGFREENGARTAIPRVLIVLTDGQSGDSVVEPSNAIRNDGVTVFGVGVGNGFNKAEVDQIATDPDATHSFALKDFEQLLSVLKRLLVERACNVVADVPVGREVAFVNQPGTTSYSQVPLPEEGSLELTFEVHDTAGTGIVYTSTSVTNPGPALHDAMFEVPLGLTVAYYNVDSAQNENDMSEGRRKRQIDSDSQPTHLFIAFETKGEEPVNVNFTATQRDGIFVSPTTASTPEPEPPTTNPTPGPDPPTINPTPGPEPTNANPTPGPEPPTSSSNPELEPSTATTPRMIDTTSGSSISKGIALHLLVFLSLLQAWILTNN